MRKRIPQVLRVGAVNRQSKLCFARVAAQPAEQLVGQPTVPLAVGVLNQLHGQRRSQRCTQLYCPPTCRPCGI